MTHLNKPIRRETDAYYRQRKLVIQIEPPDIIRVKGKGRKIWYVVSVNDIYSLGAKKYAQQAKIDKQNSCLHLRTRYGKCLKCKKQIKKG